MNQSNNNDRNTVLITGGTGFIGQMLLERISTEKLSIKIATRQPTKLAYPTITVGNINGLTDWKAAIQGVSTVIHLAAYAHVTQPSQIDTQTLYETNVLGTENLIKQCIAAGVQHFIFISSIGAVTSLSNTPLTEQSACRPDTLYGKSKLRAEQHLTDFAQNTNLTWTILRPPLVYGLGNPGNMARLQTLIRRQIPLPLASIANQRSFIYVENLVDAIITCITHPKARNQTFLISDGQNLSTPDLIRKIAHHSHHTCRLFPLPIPLLKAAGYCGDLIETLIRRPLPLNSDTIIKLTSSLPIDSRKIRETLNWQPPYTMDEGLAQTFRDYHR